MGNGCGGRDLIIDRLIGNPPGGRATITAPATHRLETASACPHLMEPTHNVRCIAILQENYPTCQEARAELNELPLGAEKWKG